MTSRHLAILLAAAAQGCAVNEPSPNAEAYRTSVARALGYYEGSDKRYLISTPWQELLGRQNVCTREEIVDHSGNKVQTDPTTVYVLEGSRIVDSGSDDLCLFRDYGPLQPVKAVVGSP
jgi:hypothetical protein